MESKKNVTKKGGVEFFGKIHDCYLANLHLSIPIRILMRIENFKADSFATFEKIISQKLSTIDNILDTGTNRQTEIISHELFIRAENNRFEISLDSSGGFLHKRGIKENTSHANLSLLTKKIPSCT